MTSGERERRVGYLKCASISCAFSPWDGKSPVSAEVSHHERCDLLASKGLAGLHNVLEIS